MTEAAGLAGRAGHWAALAWGAGQALGARGARRRTCVGRAGGRKQALGRRRTGAQADAGQARRRAAGARGVAAGARGRVASAGRGARGGRLGGLCASGVFSWARLGV